MKLKTKYGEVIVSEGENGEVEITYCTDYNVLCELKNTNTIKFHTIKPRTDRVLTIKNLVELDKKPYVVKDLGTPITQLKNIAISIYKDEN